MQIKILVTGSAKIKARGGQNGFVVSNNEKNISSGEMDSCKWIIAFIIT